MDAKEQLEGMEIPRLRPVSLAFGDPALERRYQAERARTELPHMRFGMFMAALLYFGFAFVEPSLIPHRITMIWPIRVFEIGASLLLLAASYRDGFAERLRPAGILYTSLLLAGILGMLYVVPPALVGQYYVALLLLMVASQTVLGMHPADAAAVNLFGVVMYFLIMTAGKTLPLKVAISDGMYLLSVFLLATVGGYIAERGRRNTFFARCRLEEMHRAREHDALHDPLSGLPNRRLFLERLEQAVARTRRFNSAAALLFVDLNEFKQINDRYGHSFGDQVLQNIAGLIAETVRETDTVARFGGDEFVVLLEDLEHAELADEVAERIVTRLREPLPLGNRVLRVGVSVGISLCPRHGDRPEDLLDAADRAMYLAKQEAGPGYRRSITRPPGSLCDANC